MQSSLRCAAVRSALCTPSPICLHSLSLAQLVAVRLRSGRRHGPIDPGCHSWRRNRGEPPRSAAQPRSAAPPHAQRCSPRTALPAGVIHTSGFVECYLRQTFAPQRGSLLPLHPGANWRDVLDNKTQHKLPTNLILHRIPVPSSGTCCRRRRLA
jgi:hypothetical protein